MKIVLNIEKKHLIFFSIFLVLVIGGLVIATPPWDSSKPSHELLYTDTITSKGPDGRIYIPDDLRIGENSEGSYWTLGIKGGLIQKDGNVALVKNSGDVGIGTTNPEAKLHVRGNIKITGSICGSDKCISVDGLLDTIEEMGGDVEEGNGGEDLGPGDYDIQLKSIDIRGNNPFYVCVIDHQKECNNKIDNGGEEHRVEGERGFIEGAGTALINCANRYLEGSTLGAMYNDEYVCATVE